MEGTEPWVNKGNNCREREQAQSHLLLDLPSITLMDSIQALLMNKAWFRVNKETEGSNLFKLIYPLQKQMAESGHKPMYVLL